MRFEALADWLAWQERLHPKSIDLGLGRVRRVFERMRGARRLPFTITVGGTNGKGSCVAFLDAILREQGYRVGTYTSPHLLRYNERIRRAGEPVDDARICRAFAHIDEARGPTTLSFFEFGTLAALEIFSESELDVQILEVGLGGRLDAVNIVDADVALLASIDIDHQDWLGSNRESIGFEKAGVLRPGRPAAVGDPDPPASLIEHANAIGAELACLGRDFHYRRSAEGWDWQGRAKRYRNLPVPALAGDHQLMNAAAVLQVLEFIEARWPVTEAAVRNGLRQVRLAGRFQYLPGEVPVLIDVAHNPQAVGVLARHLRSHFAGRTIHAVFALMRDKDLAGVVGQIQELVAGWYLPPLKTPRAAPPEDLAEVLRKAAVGGVFYGFPNVAEAFASARANAQNGDLIIVFGSFFLVSEYLDQCADRVR